jgi:hypothetical protein
MAVWSSFSALAQESCFTGTEVQFGGGRIGPWGEFINPGRVCHWVRIFIIMNVLNNRPVRMYL